MSEPTPAAAIDEQMRPLAKSLMENHMARFGIAPTMQFAHGYNRLKYARQDDWRQDLYGTRLPALFDENGPPARTPLEMHDGWALDGSMRLPHLERVMAQADAIIAQRSGKALKAPGAYRSFFQDMWTPADLLEYPAFLDFVTSSELLATVAHYLKSIPVLSSTLPSGIRLVESNAAFDDEPHRAKDSQLYHIDYYSLPNVYVLVLLRDTTPENGPWTFFPRAASQRAAKALDYWSVRRGYRVSDEDIYAAADRREEIAFCHPRGTVLFIESSGCFHFGSRNSVQPRFQLMLGYTGACRTDLSELTMTPRTYPTTPKDSLLRRLVLNKDLLP